MAYAGIVILSLLAMLVLFLLAVHIGFRAPRRIEQGNPGRYGLPCEEVSVTTVDGKKLFAWWLPVTEPAPSVVMLHGWGGNAELMLPLAVPVSRAGLNVLLVDARNHGRSDAASFSSLPRFAEDAGAAVDWVKARSRDPAQRIVLLGHSVGAGAVLLEASRRDDITAVISIAAFAHPEWMMRRYLEQFRVPGLFRPWILRYVEWVIGHRFDDIAPLNTVCHVRCPVLLVHGTADTTVPVSDAQAIMAHCPDNAIEFLLVDKGTHDSVEEVERHAARLLDFLQHSIGWKTEK